MGVKGLFQFLKRFEKEVSIPDFVQNKSVGLDIFWFIHKSKGDIFTFKQLLLPIISNSNKVYCVFDGKASPEKKLQNTGQWQMRQELLKTIEHIEDFMRNPFTILRNEDRNTIYSYLHELKRKAWLPSPEYIDQIKNWLTSKGCIIYQADGEADDLIVALEKDNIVDIIITNDSDILTLGANIIVRLRTPISGGLLNKSDISKNIGFTLTQWNDFMYLCSHMKECDILLAFSLISVYKELEYVLHKSYLLFQDYLIKELV